MMKIYQIICYGQWPVDDPVVLGTFDNEDIAKEKLNEFVKDNPKLEHYILIVHYVLNEMVKDPWALN